MFEPPADEGMIPLAEFEARQAEAPPEPEPQADEDELLTRTGDERLRELKRSARAMIEERLRAKRKQRRLMRGGDW